jgi:adenylosuccinate synthase
VEDGQTVGYSGDCYDDQQEMTWEEVGKLCGAPQDTFKGELTTVTKRLRRVFSFSEKQILDAVAINGATDIALNFANYIDWGCFGTNDPDSLPAKVTDFIKKLEDLTGIKVSIVGTGPRNNHVCYLD